jgi:hypothetical protein
LLESVFPLSLSSDFESLACLPWLESVPAFPFSSEFESSPFAFSSVLESESPSWSSSELESSLWVAVSSLSSSSSPPPGPEVSSSPPSLPEPDEATALPISLASRSNAAVANSEVPVNRMNATTSVSRRRVTESWLSSRSSGPSASRR